MANSKWLDYEGLEYYTKKLDTKLEDYAKTSDLSNYVTSSTLSTELGAYLPLIGGTLTGKLTTNAEVEMNDVLSIASDTVNMSAPSGTLTISDKNSSGDTGVIKVYPQVRFTEEVSMDVTTSINGDLYFPGGNDVTDLTNYKVLLLSNSSYVHRASLDTLKSEIGGSGVSNGVYIAYTDSSYAGHIALPSEYDGSGTVCGVLVIEGSKQLLIAPEETLLPWWSANSGTPDVLTTTATTNAAQDFDGKENTKILYDWGITSESYAAGYCYAYSHGTIPATKWWLPALGEVIIMRRYYSDINSALSVIGGTSLPSGYHWSSTAYSSDYVWNATVSRSYTSTNGKTISGHVRPVSAFHFVEQL